MNNRQDLWHLYNQMIGRYRHYSLHWNHSSLLESSCSLFALNRYALIEIIQNLNFQLHELLVYNKNVTSFRCLFPTHHDHLCPLSPTEGFAFRLPLLPRPPYLSPSKIRTKLRMRFLEQWSAIDGHSSESANHAQPFSIPAALTFDLLSRKSQPPLKCFQRV